MLAVKELRKRLFPSPPQNIIHLTKNSEIPHIYDVDMNHLDELKQYDSVESHIIVYPYSRKVGAHHFKFYPFEEYVHDILSHQKSAYEKISSQFNKFLGIFLGIVITGIFALFNPKDLLSVQSIMSVIGAYFVGKEIWDDVENALIQMTKHWRVKYVDNYYSYRLEKHTTLTMYSSFAKKQRYGKTSLLPEFIDFIEQSNSQTLRMFFNMDDIDLEQCCDGEHSTTRHLFSIHIVPDLLDDFEQEGFLFGVKLSLNKKAFGITVSNELFQSFHQGAQGALDDQGFWHDGSMFYRRTMTIGRWKFFLKSGILPQQTIIARSAA